MGHLPGIIIAWAVAYALHTAVRVHRMRLDLHAVADDLFDIAFRFDSLQDPAYTHARRGIMAMAWGAFTPCTLVLSHFLRQPVRPACHPQAAIPELQAAIITARQRAAHIVARSVLFGSASGILFSLAYAIIHGAKSGTRDVEQSVQTVMCTAASTLA